MNNSETKPKQKRKGPIRIEAIGPFVIVVTVAVLYYTLLFDWQLRKGLEWVGTQANGAEVNIGGLKTSIVKATFELTGLQLTDPKEPIKNRVEVGRINSKLLWDGLLRAKFVISDAGINDIQIGTTRKTPGKVLPPPTSSDSSYLAKAKAKVSGVVLAEVGDLLQGFNPKELIKDVKDLKSLARVGELKTELSQKETQWSKVLDTLPGEKEFSTLQTNVTALGGSTNNPAEAAKKVTQLTSYVKESESKLSTVKTQGETLIKEVTSFSGLISEIDNLVKQDRADIEKLLKLPSIDTKSIAAQLFGSSALNKLEQVQKYVALGRQYMPAKQKKQDSTPELLKKKRAGGRNYEFGHQNTYPRFWLQKASISSTGQNSALGGDVTGTISDVTSNPPLLGRPAIAEIRADFPKAELRKIEATIIIDHTKDEAVETVKGKIGEYHVSDQMISNSDKLKFGFSKATGTAALEARLRGDKILFVIGNTFNNVNYTISAQSKLLQETLQTVAKGIPIVNVEAKIDGTWKDPDISVSSNLAAGLQSGFEKQLQAKLSEARKQIDALIQEKVGKPKAELMARYNDTKSKFTSQIEEKKKKAEAIRAQATSKIDSIKKQATPAASQLKKKLRF